MADNKVPKLRVSRAEAAEKIRSRIDIGKELLETQVSSQKELTDFEHAIEKWADYNITLFNTLFDNSPLSSLVHGNKMVWVTNQTLSQETDGHKRDIARWTNDLESIYEQLKLYEETTPTKDKLRYAKDNNGIQEPDDNQIPEHHQNQNRSEFWNRKFYFIGGMGLILAFLDIAFGDRILIRLFRWVWSHLQTLL